MIFGVFTLMASGPASAFALAGRHLVAGQHVPSIINGLVTLAWIGCTRTCPRPATYCRTSRAPRQPLTKYSVAR